jgi:hypothetical protein
MHTIEVKQVGPILNKLQFVKLIKEHSGKGLKDSKDWVDKFDYLKCPIQTIEIYNPTIFEKDILSVDGVEFITTFKKREKKLIQIGIGSIEDKINYLCEDLAYDLMGRFKVNIGDIDKVSNFFKEKIFSKIDEKNIDILIQDED